jgi:hypothetical protein
VRKQRCVRDDELCKRSLQTRDTTDHAEDFFAGMKASNAVTNDGDSTCHVEAEHSGKWLLCVAAFACSDFGVEGIDAAGKYFHEHLTAFRLRCGDFYCAKWAVRTFYNVCLHVVPSASGSCEIAGLTRSYVLDNESMKLSKDKLGSHRSSRVAMLDQHRSIFPSSDFASNNTRTTRH